ncbi:Adenosine deaminase CECR1-A [Sparassis crispa]|uniref:adenosine deaminase n=1 Tax=Sparassis crispa TaxID=139825 RepID=A0A401H3Y4_9APHY|nr:Adenosine deaminase CECR1-A [Sparassis crispa]GBE89111.1 Adenosine deaminase CECR1-A [Sparassis crispa]
MEEYLERRKQLIHADRAQRVDSPLNRASLTDLEQRADAVVRSIRTAEAKSVWAFESKSIFEYSPEDTSANVFPGMEFLTARNTIIQTKLFRVLNKMPKGALLHAHLDATVNARVLLTIALTQSAMHVRASKRVTASTVKGTLPEFKGLSQANFTSFTSLTDEAYTPGEWVPIQKARENFDASLGGPEGFDEWVVGALMINPSEAYVTHNTTQKIWAKFTSTFVTSSGLIHFVPVWTEYIRQFFLSSIEDGISYMEARVNFWHKCMIGADGKEDVPHREWLIIYDRVLNEVKDELKRQGREDEFVGSKIIYVTLRHITSEELEWYLEDCLSLKQEFPHLIAGFDLVGHEDSLKPLIDYIVPLTKFVERQKELGLDIPFIFHAGETLGDGTPADMNLYDAILLGTKRIGHGFSLAKHPKLIEICKEKDIAVEMCPISNEILRLTSSMPMHPLPILVNQGVSVALCSDDPAVFGNMGLSFDFFQVLVASEVTGLITMGEFARDSLKHAAMGQEEKQRALDLWEKQWTKFLEWVVREETIRGQLKN